jgi:hypothetical protein
LETFKFPTDPQLVAKVTDVVGLYVDPPENAVVLCVDEKSQIRALDRTQPMLLTGHRDYSNIANTGRAGRHHILTSTAQFISHDGRR